MKREFGVDAELMKGSSGDFAVAVNGEEVFNIREQGHFPDPGEVEKIIKQKGLG